MLKQSFIVRITLALLFAIALMIPITLGAEQKPAPASRIEAGRFKGPIKITAAHLSADNKTGVVVFEGSVVAKSNDATLLSDRMDVKYVSGDVTEIIAIGNVKFIRDTGLLTSGRAVYVALDRKITFTESPKAVDNGNIITGTKMIYLIDEDRSLVENSTVIIEGK